MLTQRIIWMHHEKEKFLLKFSFYVPNKNIGDA